MIQATDEVIREYLSNLLLEYVVPKNYISRNDPYILIQNVFLRGPL